jgi:CIC family chloride channel protein
MRHFDEFLRQHGANGGMKHVVVARNNHIAGVIRVNTGPRRGLETHTPACCSATLRSAISR